MKKQRNISKMWSFTKSTFCPKIVEKAVDIFRGNNKRADGIIIMMLGACYEKSVSDKHIKD